MQTAESSSCTVENVFKSGMFNCWGYILYQRSEQSMKPAELKVFLRHFFGSVC
jgi:hypothetical protein